MQGESVKNRGTTAPSYPVDTAGAAASKGAPLPPAGEDSVDVRSGKAGPVINGNAKVIVNVGQGKISTDGDDEVVINGKTQKKSKHDGQFRVRRAAGFFLKGLTSMVTEMFHGPKEMLMGIGMLVGLGAVIGILGPAAAVAATTVFAGMGVMKITNFANRLMTAKNAEEKEEAFEDAGAGTTDILLSGFGATHALEGFRAAKFKAKGMAAAEADVAAKQSVHGLKFHQKLFGAIKETPNALKDLGSKISDAGFWKGLGSKAKGLIPGAATGVVAAEATDAIGKVSSKNGGGEPPAASGGNGSNGTPPAGGEPPAANGNNGKPTNGTTEPVKTESAEATKNKTENKTEKTEEELAAAEEEALKTAEEKERLKTTAGILRQQNIRLLEQERQLRLTVEKKENILVQCETWSRKYDLWLKTPKLENTPLKYDSKLLPEGGVNVTAEEIAAAIKEPSKEGLPSRDEILNTTDEALLKEYQSNFNREIKELEDSIKAKPARRDQYGDQYPGEASLQERVEQAQLEMKEKYEKVEGITGLLKKKELAEKHWGLHKNDRIIKPSDMELKNLDTGTRRYSENMAELWDRRICGRKMFNTELQLVIDNHLQSVLKSDTVNLSDVSFQHQYGGAQASNGSGYNLAQTLASASENSTFIVYTKNGSTVSSFDAVSRWDIPSENCIRIQKLAGDKVKVSTLDPAALERFNTHLEDTIYKVKYEDGTTQKINKIERESIRVPNHDRNAGLYMKKVTAEDKLNALHDKIRKIEAEGKEGYIDSDKIQAFKDRIEGYGRDEAGLRSELIDENTGKPIGGLKGEAKDKAIDAFIDSLTNKEKDLIVEDGIFDAGTPVKVEELGGPAYNGREGGQYIIRQGMDGYIEIIFKDTTRPEGQQIIHHWVRLQGKNTMRTTSSSGAVLNGKSARSWWNPRRWFEGKPGSEMQGPLSKADAARLERVFEGKGTKEDVKWAQDNRGDVRFTQAEVEYQQRMIKNNPRKAEIEQQIATHDAEIARLTDDLEMAKSSLQFSQRELRQLDPAIAENAEDIARTNLDIRKYTREISELTREIAALNTTKGSLQGELSQLGTLKFSSQFNTELSRFVNESAASPTRDSSFTPAEVATLKGRYSENEVAAINALIEAKAFETGSTPREVTMATIMKGVRDKKNLPLERRAAELEVSGTNDRELTEVYTQLKAQLVRDGVSLADNQTHLTDITNSIATLEATRPNLPSELVSMYDKQLIELKEAQKLITVRKKVLDNVDAALAPLPQTAAESITNARRQGAAELSRLDSEAVDVTSNLTKRNQELAKEIADAEAAIKKASKIVTPGRGVRVWRRFADGISDWATRRTTKNPDAIGRAAHVDALKARRAEVELYENQRKLAIAKLEQYEVAQNLTVTEAGTTKLKIESVKAYIAQLETLKTKHVDRLDVAGTRAIDAEIKTQTGLQKQLEARHTELLKQQQATEANMAKARQDLGQTEHDMAYMIAGEGADAAGARLKGAYEAARQLEKDAVKVLTDLRKDLSTAYIEISNNNADILKIRSNIGKKKLEITLLKKRHAPTSPEVTTAEGQLRTLEGELAAKEADIVAAKTRINDPATGLNKQIADAVVEKRRLQIASAEAYYAANRFENVEALTPREGVVADVVDHPATGINAKWQKMRQDNDISILSEFGFKITHTVDIQMTAYNAKFTVNKDLWTRYTSLRRQLAEAPAEVVLPSSTSSQNLQGPQMVINPVIAKLRAEIARLEPQIAVEAKMIEQNEIAAATTDRAGFGRELEARKSSVTALIGNDRGGLIKQIADLKAVLENHEISTFMKNDPVSNPAGTRTSWQDRMVDTIRALENKQKMLEARLKALNEIQNPATNPFAGGTPTLPASYTAPGRMPIPVRGPRVRSVPPSFRALNAGRVTALESQHNLPISLRPLREQVAHLDAVLNNLEARYVSATDADAVELAHNIEAVRNLLMSKGSPRALPVHGTRVVPTDARSDSATPMSTNHARIIHYSNQILAEPRFQGTEGSAGNINLANVQAYLAELKVAYQFGTNAEAAELIHEIQAINNLIL